MSANVFGCLCIQSARLTTISQFVKRVFQRSCFIPAPFSLVLLVALVHVRRLSAIYLSLWHAFIAFAHEHHSIDEITGNNNHSSNGRNGSTPEPRERSKKKKYHRVDRDESTDTTTTELVAFRASARSHRKFIFHIVQCSVLSALSVLTVSNSSNNSHNFSSHCVRCVLFNFSFWFFLRVVLFHSFFLLIFFGFRCKFCSTKFSVSFSTLNIWPNCRTLTFRVTWNMLHTHTLTRQRHSEANGNKKRDTMFNRIMIIARVRREWIVPFQRTSCICCQRRQSNLYTYPLFSENSFHCICPVRRRFHIVCISDFSISDFSFYGLALWSSCRFLLFFFVVFCSVFDVIFMREWCVPSECIFCCACTCIVRSWVSLLSRCRLLNEYGAVAAWHAAGEREKGRQSKKKHRMKRNDSLCAQQTTFLCSTNDFESNRNNSDCLSSCDG